MSRHCRLAVPPFEAFDLVTNKARLLEYAGRCGVPMPRTHARRRTRATAARSSIASPIRRSSSRCPRASGPPGDGCRAASTTPTRRAELEAAVRDARLSRRPPVADPGAHRRTRRRHVRAVRSRHGWSPSSRTGGCARNRPSGGASVLSESLPVDPRLREFALRLLGADRLARRRDDGIQAGSAHRRVRPDGGQRPVLGLAASSPSRPASTFRSWRCSCASGQRPDRLRAVRRSA